MDQAENSLPISWVYLTVFNINKINFFTRLSHFWHQIIEYTSSFQLGQNI